MWINDYNLFNFCRNYTFRKVPKTAFIELVFELWDFQCFKIDFVEDNGLQFEPFSCKWWNCTLKWLSSIPWRDAPQMFYPFLFQWAPGLCPCFCYCRLYLYIGLTCRSAFNGLSTLHIEFHSSCTPSTPQVLLIDFQK